MARPNYPSQEKMEGRKITIVMTRVPPYIKEEVIETGQMETCGPPMDQPTKGLEAIIDLLRLRGLIKEEDGEHLLKAMQQKGMSVKENKRHLFTLNGLSSGLNSANKEFIQAMSCSFGISAICNGTSPQEDLAKLLFTSCGKIICGNCRDEQVRPRAGLGLLLFFS